MNSDISDITINDCIYQLKRKKPKKGQLANFSIGEYSCVLLDRPDLVELGYIPAICTCTDWIVRRAYNKGEAGLCKHLKALSGEFKALLEQDK